MKIVYLVRQIDAVGGRERVLANKANYLARNYGYKIFIVTMFQSNEATIFDLDSRIQVHHLKLATDKSIGHGRLKYFRYVKSAIENKLVEIDPDVTVSMWWGIEFKVLPFINDGSRKILEYHFSQYARYRYAPLHGNEIALLSKARLLITRWLENRLVERYDRFVVLTEEDKAYWNNKNAVVIPNALSFVTDKKSDSENLAIVSAGRLSEQKGFDRLIRIWASVEDNCSDWELKIYGDGIEKENLLRLIKELNLTRVTLMPATVNLEAEFLKASIFVFTSRYEGFGMVLTEAMQCGLPVVSYDTRCGPRDIIDDGVSGFVVKEGDERDFLEKLGRLMIDKALRLRMGAAAKRLSNQKFSEDSIMKKWKTLFEGLAQKETP